MDTHRHIQVEVAEALRPYAGLAVNRLTYLFRDVTFQIDGDLIRARVPYSKDATEIMREIAYALYREKIYADTLSMRKCFFEAVTRP